jgi:4-amino-4-deoxy-L-arabinose transferase-like glycosyltransferase
MWVANYNPPLMSYFLAGVAALFGWNEIILHLACLAVAFTAAAGIYSLAKMWCERPLLATVVAIFTPVFLVSSTTLMCDVLMLTFWIWALVFWERALASGQGRWQFIGAGALAGLAVLTKYGAVTLLPLLPLMSILRTRKLGWWWLAGAAVPWIMMAAYEWMTAGMYGRGLLSVAAGFAQSHPSEFVGGWMAREIVGLAFAGGCLLPLLCFAPCLWQWRALLKGSAVIFGALLALVWLGGDLGLFTPLTNSEAFNHWGFRLQVILLTAGGLHCLLLIGAEIWQRRDRVAVTLALWIISGLFFAMVLNWMVNARSFLPIVPAAAILLVRRLGAMRGNLPAGGWLLWPLVPSAAITLSLMLADYQLANSSRTAAEQITAQYQPANHKLWFEQHMGIQYYLEELGGQPLDCERSVFQPGDIVVVPWVNYGFVPLPPGSVGWIEPLIYRPRSWINLAGFYGGGWGPVPFAVGGLPPQEFYILKVFSGVQFNSRPVNPREVLAGCKPDITGYSATCDNTPSLPVNPDSEKQTQLACQFEADGKIEEAIQHYRKALEVDSNNIAALNNLAWIRATAGKPGLRDGQEAVQLATKAVKLTDSRQPLIIGTLGAAYAEAGQFEKAIQAAKTAEFLALFTSQNEVAAKNLKLLSQYAAGRAVEASGNP